LRFLLIDAEDVVLGRLAAQISKILQVRLAPPTPPIPSIHVSIARSRARLINIGCHSDCPGLTVLAHAQGKTKPSYCQNRDMGDVCVVVNAEKVHLSGKKLDQMVYRWHTG
jgi:ribosomal protein L13